MANQNDKTNGDKSDATRTTTPATQPGGAFDPAVLQGALSSTFQNLFSGEKRGVDTKPARSNKNNAFVAAVNTKRMAEVMGLDEQLIIDDLNMTPLEKEQNPYMKTDLSDDRTIRKSGDGRRLDDPIDGTATIMGCKITVKEKDKGKIVRIKSDYLGDFEYDPSQFALGYKELEDGSQLPVLEYIGDGDGAGSNFEAFGVTLYMDGSDIKIPDGLKRMDYMFADNDKLKYVPPIPSSVVSMHYAFAECDNLKYSVTPTREYNVPWSADLLPEAKDVMLGHTIVLPDGLEDMSGAFKNCKSLTSGFCTASDVGTDGSIPIGDVDNPIIDIPLNGVITDRPNLGLPSSVVNIQGAFEGCESLDSETILSRAQEWRYGRGENYSEFPKYGGDITPYLTSEFAKNALNKITDEKAKSYADSVKFIVNDEGMIDPEMYEKAKEAGVVFDESLLGKSRAATREKFLEGIHDGNVATDPEIASGGQRSNNYYYDAACDDIKDDVTGLVVSDAKPGLTSWLERLAVDGAVGLGIAGVANKVTGSGLLGLATGVVGAAALDHLDVIPESISPVVCWTRDLLPDGKVKDLLSDFADKLSGSKIQGQLDGLTAENVAATHQNRRLQYSIQGIKGVYELADVEKAMYNNAEYCGVNLNLKATADVAMQSGEHQATAGAREVVAVSLASMEDTWSRSKDPEGMRDYYVDVMSALEAYNKGALSGISKLENEDYRDTSKQGLTMLNRAYVDEVMTSLKEMDGKYHFMDDAAWSKISGMSISGVDISNARNYDPARIKELSDMSVAQVKSIVDNSEDYKVGVIQRNKADGSSFYAEGKGKFYNEGVPVTDPIVDTAQPTKEQAVVKKATIDPRKRENRNKNIVTPQAVRDAMADATTKADDTDKTPVSATTEAMKSGEATAAKDHAITSKRPRGTEAVLAVGPSEPSGGDAEYDG